MPEYKWTLKNKKFCTGCPMHYTDIGEYVPATPTERIHGCTADFYIDVRLPYDSQKKRPITCVRELGE